MFKSRRTSVGLIVTPLFALVSSLPLLVLFTTPPSAAASSPVLFYSCVLLVDFFLKIDENLFLILSFNLVSLLSGAGSIHSFGFWYYSYQFPPAFAYRYNSVIPLSSTLPPLNMRSFEFMLSKELSKSLLIIFGF
jgi:hypothetical protein